MPHIDNIRAGIKREEVDGYHLVNVCQEECEGHFSWHPCDICCQPLGGERHPGALIKPGSNEEPISVDMCVCCMTFIINGDECNCRDIS